MRHTRERINTSASTSIVRRYDTMMDEKEFEKRRNEILKKFFSAKSKMEYCHAFRKRLIKEFGGCCKICNSTGRLQFAHIDDTFTGGTGRGRILRYIDIELNRDAFILLCVRCHSTFGVLSINTKDNKHTFDIAKKIIDEDKNFNPSRMLEFNIKNNRFVLKEEFKQLLHDF
jgi:hypothetical protein